VERIFSIGSYRHLGKVAHIKAGPAPVHLPRDLVEVAPARATLHTPSIP